MTMKIRNKTKKKVNEERLTPEKIEVFKILYKEHIYTLLTASQSYDKAILSLSTVTLGFTFAFIELAKYAKPLKSTCLLGFTWGLLILSIFFILASFLSDQRYSANEMKIYGQAITGEDSSVDDMPNTKFIMWISPIISGLSFVTAISLFAIFVGKNTWG